MDRTITVTGTGEAAGVPDVVELNLGVRVQESGATAALRTASRRARDLIEALAAAGVAEADVATINIAVWPEYAPPTNRVIGYEASNELRVRFRDTSRAGEVIDAAATVVGDAITINSLSFLIEDTTELASAARAAAMAAARRAAEELAAAAGAQVGSVVSIAQHSGGGGPMPMPRGMEVMATFSAPLEPGTQQVTAHVTVVYELV